MLARLAESLLWAGRYLERAEDTARMMDVTYHGLLETHQADTERAWASLLGSLGQLPAFEATGRRSTEEAVTAFLVVDRDNPGSVASSVQAVRENIRSVHEQVSAELWEAVNRFHLELMSRDLTRDLERQRYELYGTVKLRCQMIAGVAAETMPRDDGWRFFSIGRQLERAIMGARLLDVYFHDLAEDRSVDFHQWRNLLRAASAFEAYGRRHGSSISAWDAVDFLLLDDHHPRSILFCLRRAEEELALLESPNPAHPSQRVLGRARARLEFSEAGERHGPSREAFVGQLIDDVQRALDSITAEFLAQAHPGVIHAYGVR